MLFSVQIPIKKVLKNCFFFQLLASSIDFPAFGKILVLVNAFFYANSNSKNIEKLFFSAFGKIFLVLVNAFFY